MKIQKQEISHFLRSIGLSRVADYIRYQIMRFRNRETNSVFRKKYPDVAMPPGYMMYESFQLNYFKYYEGGREDAQEIIEKVNPHLPDHPFNILDWGCGPARIIRHLPELTNHRYQYFGTDYNPQTIEWCKSNIPAVQFNLNGLIPPLPYADQFFHFIYSISVLTHLSEVNQFMWLKEIRRILHPDGIAYMTTHGEAFKAKMIDEEIQRFQQNQIVERENVKEGHRMYGAFHPPELMREIFKKSGFDVVEHIPGRRVDEGFISQDVWNLK